MATKLPWAGPSANGKVWSLTLADTSGTPGTTPALTQGFHPPNPKLLHRDPESSSCLALGGFCSSPRHSPRGLPHPALGIAWPSSASQKPQGPLLPQPGGSLPLPNPNLLCGDPRRCCTPSQNSCSNLEGFCLLPCFTRILRGCLCPNSRGFCPHSCFTGTPRHCP